MDCTKSFDAKTVKEAATGRWLEILQTVGGLPREVLDGKHHPCPKCGGEDRFRLIDMEAGAALCNQCFYVANGDGIAAVQWATGLSFRESLERIAEHCGINSNRKPTANGKVKANPVGKSYAPIWNRRGMMPSRERNSLSPATAM